MTRPAGGPRAPVPALAGAGLLADDLYLIGHHEVTGRPLLSPRAAGPAGALLAELVLAGAGVAPLTVAAGVIPTAYATTGLTGIPAAFVVIAIIRYLLRSDAPIRLPGSGPLMRPMWREPNHTNTH